MHWSVGLCYYRVFFNVFFISIIYFLLSFTTNKFNVKCLKFLEYEKTRQKIDKNCKILFFFRIQISLMNQLYSFQIVLKKWSCFSYKEVKLHQSYIHRELICNGSLISDSKLSCVALHEYLLYLRSIVTYNLMVSLGSPSILVLLTNQV